jgi:glycine/D-amino acid oxidase-like deaminating enzyme/nitrite reductase/ring-hydroxylating ferredoxin subunit
MSGDSGRTLPLWLATAHAPRLAPLVEPQEADVCIIGAGIAGLASAYQLATAGRRVIVLDDGPPGGGETGRTTAHLANALDDRFHHLEKLHGEDGVRLAAASHGAAIDWIERVAQEEAIDCDFARVDGLLFFPGADGEDRLERELAAARRAGVDAAPFDAPFSPFERARCIRFPRQARCHAIRFLAGLVRAIGGRDGRLYQAHVEAVHDGTPVRVETSAGIDVRAQACIVATNSPISDMLVTHIKQAPYRTYVVGARVPRGAVPDALYWDDEDPYHYIRLQPLDETSSALLVGGEDHKTGQEADPGARLDTLEAWMRARFPMAGPLEWCWSGQVLEPSDGLAFIGPNPGSEHVYIATGDSGQGITHGAIAGMLLTDLILGRPNPWADLYAPGRLTLRAAPELLKENLNVAGQYARSAVAGERVEDAPIHAGEGRVIRRNGKKIAAYRDDEGILHERSAICTHMKCVVGWNALEKSWDCPCHGSRFDVEGNVLNGPALDRLGPAED